MDGTHRNDELFGTWLARKLATSPLTAQQLADGIGVSKSMLNNVLNNYRDKRTEKLLRLAPEKVIKLAEMLGVSVAEALSLAGYFVHHPTLSQAGLEVGELVDLMDKMDQDDVKAYAELRIKIGNVRKQGGGGMVKDSGIVTSDPRSRRNRHAAKKESLRRVS